MMEFMDKKDILDLKQQGVSNRETARRLGVDRKTVAKYWNEYKLGMTQLIKNHHLKWWGARP